MTVVVALIGGMAARKIKIPAGGLVGALVFVAAFNILFARAYVASWMRTVLQILAGASLGAGIGKDDIRQLKLIVLPTIILVAGLTVINLFTGFMIHKLGGLDIPTALFASTPGGMTDMALISQELGADTVTVAIIQLCRILFIITFMPPIFKRIINRDKGSCVNRNTGTDNPLCGDVVNKNNDLPDKQKGIRIVLTLLTGAAGGLLLYFAGVNAGALIGSMMAVGAVSIYGKSYMPPKTKTYIQIFAGAFIGSQMDYGSLAAMKQLIIPILIMFSGILAFTFIISFAMHKITKLDRSTCLLASTPGGIQEMCLLADDLGVDMPKVTVMQTVRLVFVISFFPAMLSFLTGLLVP